MDLKQKKVTVALRDAPVVATAWGRHVGVPQVVVGTVAEQSEVGLYLAPIEVVHLNNGSKAETGKDEMFAGLLVPWRSISSVAVH